MTKVQHMKELKADLQEENKIDGQSAEQAPKPKVIEQRVGRKLPPIVNDYYKEPQPGNDMTSQVCASQGVTQLTIVEEEFPEEAD